MEIGIQSGYSQTWWEKRSEANGEYSETARSNQVEWHETESTNAAYKGSAESVVTSKRYEIPAQGRGNNLNANTKRRTFANIHKDSLTPFARKTQNERHKQRHSIDTASICFSFSRIHSLARCPSIAFAWWLCALSLHTAIAIYLYNRKRN